MTQKQQINQGEELFQIETMSDGLRNTGYKSTYNAIAEIVDNSIEANAKNVFIIGTQDLTANRQNIIEFAFLDNGDGMDLDTLSKCLKIGFSTRRARKGMGRFGVGLPQASFTVCPCVEVYSWNDNYKNAKWVCVDLDKVSASEQDRIFGPKAQEIPDRYEKFIKFNTGDKVVDFSKHGTLVIWSRCDNVDNRKWNTCRRKVAEDLGRKYRWMIKDDSIEINTVEINDLNSFSKILPNDPLYLMTNSQTCVKNEITDSDCDAESYNAASGYTECIFEPFTSDVNKTGIVEKEVYYFDKKTHEKKTSKVTIRFSIVKEKYYDKKYITKDPGTLPYGKCVKSNAGISIVRQGREIDFGYFGFADATNNPFHRWWGCEISFTSELDEAFGISNNKQQVSLKEIDKESIVDYEGEEPMWLQLKDTISGTISAMVARNKELRSGSRSVDVTVVTTPVSVTVEKAEEKNPDIVVEIEKPENITDEIKEQVKTDLQLEGIEDITDEKIQQYLDSNTRVVYVNWGERQNFIDFETKLGVLKITVNKDHSFYKKFLIDVYEDENSKLTFELFLVALIKTICDKRNTYPQVMDEIIDGVNRRIKEYLNQDE